MTLQQDALDPLTIDRLLTDRRLRFALPLAVTLSLMVLGGDPQMAYHAVLLGGVYAWLRRTDGQSVRPRRTRTD